MSQKISISVVIPTYNSEAFITETLQSVINQTVLPLELIVSDDGSTDNTINIVEEFFQNYNNLDTLLIKNKHKGAGRARNSGIKASSGDWIAFLDSDDRWLSAKIKEVNEVIENNSKYNFIFHNEERWNLNGKKTILHDFSCFFDKSESLIKQVWRYCIFHTSAVTVKKELLFKRGLFSEDLLSSQDWELWLRLAPYIDYYHINMVLGIYVDRINNITNTKSIRGLNDRLKVMSMHWRDSGASIWEYIYMVLRRILGYLLRETRIIK